MPADPRPPLTDEALDRLARDWFAEARARTRDDEQSVRRTRPAGTTSDADSGILDWLFGGDAADDGACDDGGGDSD